MMPNTILTNPAHFRQNLVTPHHPNCPIEFSLFLTNDPS
ncbi:uncharacterized protein Dmul_22770 [Desulfococcus multivorans]|nr:uncharacterized protein Dmul_22770 [Desulfococcus multivorans]